MSSRVNTNLLTEMKKYGAVNPEACFNCGNCTAVCPLTDDGHPFPRSTIRLLQLGLEDKLLESTDPWMCYYCGDCTKTCPRGAEPAETMMAARRWLTAKYDATGHGSKMYQSEKATLWAVIRSSVLVLALLVIYHIIMYVINGEPVWATVVNEAGNVPLNTFAPVWLLWTYVLIHGVLLASRLIRGSLNMGRNVMRSTTEQITIPFSVWATEFKDFVLHFLTQKRWRDCDDKEHTRWFKHLILISGYITMLTLVVVFLWWFQSDRIYPITHIHTWLPYLAAALLIYGATEALLGRLRKQEEIHRWSHPTDWLFPTFILTSAVTGVLANSFRYGGLIWATYILYTIHVMTAMSMLDTEVGVGKWTHLIYRPLAMYLESVKKRASELEQTKPAPAPAGMD